MSDEGVALRDNVFLVNGNEMCYTHQVYNEAIVVPENMDAIRALACSAANGQKAMRITDQAQGVRRDFLAR